ncbi:MAG TPA: tetratricopeptide repeat protein [Candidatus Hydrogenedentes bacterium]|mgnify:CR=1 FL=1|nr:tetratricopeptide repeat protein [Candidatus Hydrogenedentota bacterium]HOH28239.1 tetratricopeptide repeat protein [Candidatus Hydrogenedentota bacterium]
MVSREQRQRQPILADVALGLLIFLSLFAAGYGHLRALRTDRSAVTGIELLYGPSVMLALGHGFIEPDLLEYPALRAFLRAETEALPPDAVPAQVRENPSSVASYHRYLVYTVALFWRLLGISWTSLEPLLALLFAWSGVAVYGIMRLGMRRALAVVITLAFMVSPAMLGTLTELRDFSKAPFILSVLLALGWLIRYKAGFRTLMLAAVFLGLAVGTGMGFRQDVFVFLPLSLAVLFVAAFRVDRQPRLPRLLSLPLCLLCFYSAAWPMLGRMEGAAHPDHHLVQGFSTKRLDNLGILPASYRPVASGSDCYVFSMLQDHMRRVCGEEAGHFARNTAGSDQAGRRWLLDAVTLFPADLAARGYAAVWRNLRYADAYPPTFLEPTPWHHALYAVHRGIAAHLHRFGIVYGLAALCIIAGYHPALGLGAYLFVLYVLGYIALQCEYRHAFHLAFFPFWIVGFLVERTVSAVGYIRKHGLPERNWGRRVCLRISFVLACCLLMLAPPLAALRLYQSARLRPLLDVATQAPRTRVSVAEQHLHGWTLFAVTHQEPPTQHQDVKALSKILASLLSPELRLWHVRGRYFVAEFKAEAGVDWLIQKYESPIFFNDFSQLVRLPDVANEGIIRCYFPVYELLMPSLEREFLLGRNHFTGIALPDNQADAFLGLYEVEIPEGLNLLMHCAQSNDDPPDTLYQRIGFSPDPVLYYQSEKNATDNLNLAEAARRFRSREEALFFIRAQQVLSRQPETQLVLAGWLLDKEAPEDALEAALEIRTTSPDLTVRKANLLEMIGRHFQIRGKPAPMEKAFTTAWELAPEKEIPLRLELAILYGKETRAKEALSQYRSVLLSSPDNEMGIMNADLLLTRHADPEQRAVFWEEIARTHPGALHPWLRLGMARETAGDTVAAASAYAAVFRSHPEVPEAAIRHAAFSADSQETAAVRALLNRALENAPDLKPLAVECLLKNGIGQAEAGSTEKALSIFSLATEYDPQNEWLRLKRAQTLAIIGNTGQARSDFESLLEGPYGRDAGFGLQRLLQDSDTPPLEYWRSLDANHPGNEHVRFFLGQAGGSESRALFESGSYAEAARTLRESCPDPCVNPERAVLRYLAELSETGGEAPALQVRQLIQANKTLAAQTLSWILSAMEHLKAAGNTDRAVTLAQTAVDIMPEAEAGWSALVRLYLDQENFEAAVDSGIRGLHALPDASPLAELMDDAFMRMNDREKRLQVWEKIAEEQPGSPLALLHLGLAFEAGERWREAAETYKRLVANKPGSPDLHLRLGSALVRAGKVEEGTRALLEATTPDAADMPASPQLLQQAGNILLEAKQPEPAERMYRRAVEIAPEDGFTRLRLGEALTQQQKNEGALEAWKQAILLKPDAPAAEQAARLIHRRLAPEERLPWWHIFAEHSPDIPLVRAYHALACACAGDTGQAKELLRTIAVSQSNVAEHGMITGILTCLSGDSESGVTQIRAAAEERPELKGDAADYLVEMGIALQEKRSFDAAEPLFRAATLLEPDNLLHSMHLGKTLLERTRFHEAIEIFVQILMTVPESPRTADLLEEAFRRNQDPEGRLRVWQSIVNAHPGAVVPRQHLTETR